MLPIATSRMPSAVSAATRPSGASVAATSSAPKARTTTTPAAMRQSSPTTKSYQKRAECGDVAHQAPPRDDRGARSAAPSPSARSHHSASRISSARSPPGHSRLARRARRRPGPRRPRTCRRSHSSRPTTNLMRVLRAPAPAGGVQPMPAASTITAGHGRADHGERDRVGAQAERDDDEDDLEALQEDALEGDDEGEPVEPDRRRAPACARRLDLCAKTSSSSCSAFRPAERRIALRSHCSPKISSRVPTTSWSSASGNHCTSA